MILLTALLLTLMTIKFFGIVGIYAVLFLIFVWQLIFRLKNGYWMQGVDHSEMK